MIDLHMHSTYSDGSCTPAELIAIACESNLQAIALTDHDTIGGIPEFLATESEKPIRRLTGVELSAEFSPGTMHILGYCIDHEAESLRSKLDWIRSKRESRNTEILQRLNSLGLEIGWDEVAGNAGSDVVGRPHFAQAMIARGYCRDKQDAFDRYLAKGKRGYIDRKRLSPENCIRLIRAAGGVPVLAHPITLKLTNIKLEGVVGELREMGLGGIECYYSKYSRKESEKMMSIARDLGLVMTGGSDFHGADSPAVKMGRGFGNLQVPEQLLEQLLECADRVHD